MPNKRPSHHDPEPPAVSRQDALFRCGVCHPSPLAIGSRSDGARFARAEAARAPSTLLLVPVELVPEKFS